MKQVTIQIDDCLRKRLGASADKQGHSFAEEVRQRLWWTYQQGFDSRMEVYENLQAAALYEQAWLTQ